MLIFIAISCFLYAIVFVNSNTSHVNLYLLVGNKNYFCFDDSNTSHVNLYHHPRSRLHLLLSIQIHLMLIFIAGIIDENIFNLDSNTSHVNLYHNGMEHDARRLLYANTAHVNLYPESLWEVQGIVGIQIHLMLIFIRISCWKQYMSTAIQIHLMLIFIVMGISTLAFLPYSNTSHVNLYRKPWFNKEVMLKIQIHLMLIFIHLAFFTTQALSLFKYISC